MAWHNGRGIFAFSWSLNEFVLILLLGYPKIETIPVQVYQFVGGYYLHPQQAATLGLFLLVPTWRSCCSSSVP